MKYGYSLRSHFSGVDVYAVLDKHYNVRGEYATLGEAKNHLTDVSDIVELISLKELWSIHDDDGNNPLGIWFPYETRALAALYKLISPPRWTEYVSVLEYSLSEDDEDLFDMKNYYIMLEDRIRPVYVIAYILRDKYPDINQFPDEVSLSGVDSELLAAGCEMYKVLFDLNNQITTLRVKKDSSYGTYYVEDINGAVVSKEKFITEIRALAYIYKMTPPQSWRAYHRSIYYI